MRIREATVADIAAMHVVRVAVKENRLSSPDRIKPADYEQALATGCGWVAEVGSEIVGFAFGQRSGNVWALFVHPEHEGRGYGSALHRVLLAWLEENAARPIWLSTAPGTRAEAFYRAKGWRDCGMVEYGERRFERGRLRYFTNVTLDGCVDHRGGSPDEETFRHATDQIASADAVLWGRVTYEMMESAWRHPAPAGARPEWMAPFTGIIGSTKKYVVSSTLERVDWNAELVRGDLAQAVRALKQRSPRGVLLGGVTLPLALANLGLIDEYVFVVHPRIAGHGPSLLAGLSKHVELKLVDRQDFGSGALALRYEPK